MAIDVVPEHRDAEQLRLGLAAVRNSPADSGAVEMVVARPDVGERAVLDRGTLTTTDGLVGDDWLTRGDASTPDGSAHPEAQVTMINRAWLDHISSGDRTWWPLAGDQLVVDLDLSTDNLAPGDQLRVGTALVEVTAKPHTGCKQFAARYGIEAQRMVASAPGKALRLRGIYVKVVNDGDVAAGDAISKVG